MKTVQDFAKSLNISKAIVDTWLYRHGLPHIQIGRRIYIVEDDFKTWLNAHKKVVNQDPPAMIKEVSIPKRSHQSNIASKMKRIY